MWAVRCGCGRGKLPRGIWEVVARADCKEAVLAKLFSRECMVQEPGFAQSVEAQLDCKGAMPLLALTLY